MVIFLLILLILLLISMICFLIFHIGSLFIGAPYVGTGKERLQQMLDVANVQPGEKTIDLGSGDGRIVIAMAQKGARAYGYEINPFFVLISWWNIWRLGLVGKAHVSVGNLWKVDLSSFDVITVYGISYMMEDLEEKVTKEMKPQARIITNCYSFPTWKYEKKIDHTFLYRKHKA